MNRFSPRGRTSVSTLAASLGTRREEVCVRLGEVTEAENEDWAEVVSEACSELTGCSGEIVFCAGSTSVEAALITSSETVGGRSVVDVEFRRVCRAGN